MEETECSETSAYKIQTPGNYPEESIQHSEQDESLKSRKIQKLCVKKEYQQDATIPTRCNNIENLLSISDVDY